VTGRPSSAGGTATRPGDEPTVRRRVVVAVTLVAGLTLLGLTLATTPGDSLFYPMTLGVAVVWVIGGRTSGPIPLGPARGFRTILGPIGLGLAAAAVFVLGALVVREIEPLRQSVAHVLAHSRQGNELLVGALALLTGAAEEVLFRGALYAALGPGRPVLISTAIYTVATIATGNPMLVLAALLMGSVFALERQVTGGVLAPMLTHVTWSLVMLLALPPLIGS
jgi:hypothetical protein